MRVRDIMKFAPVTADLRTPICDVAMLMVEFDCGEVPVTDRGRLAGVVTDRDIACRVVAAGRDPFTTLIKDVMTAEPVSIGPDKAVTAAVRLMESAQIRRLPVVDERGGVVGIISMTDLCDCMPHWSAGELLREISRKHPAGEIRPTALESFPPHVSRSEIDG